MVMEKRLEVFKKTYIIYLSVLENLAICSLPKCRQQPGTQDRAQVSDVGGITQVLRLSSAASLRPHQQEAGLGSGAGTPMLRCGMLRSEVRLNYWPEQLP